MFRLSCRLLNGVAAFGPSVLVMDKNTGAAAFTIAGSVIPLNTYIDYITASGV